MGWYDDEEQDWLLDWAVTPLMWIGCLMVAAPPAGMAIAFWNAVLPDAPPAASPVAYGVSLGTVPGIGIPSGGGDRCLAGSCRMSCPWTLGQASEQIKNIRTEGSAAYASTDRIP